MTMLATFCGVNIWFGWNYMYVHSCYLHNADNETDEYVVRRQTDRAFRAAT